MTLNIYLIGLPLNHHTIPVEIQENVSQRLEDLQSHMRSNGINFNIIYFSPESGLDGFVDILKNHNCDGVVIGGGVKINPDMTYFMEQIVNTVQSYAPKSKIMFINKPEDTYNSIKRWFN